jgi:hypothetical protein
LSVFAPAGSVNATDNTNTINNVFVRIEVLPSILELGTFSTVNAKKRYAIDELKKRRSEEGTGGCDVPRLSQVPYGVEIRVAWAEEV